MTDRILAEPELESHLEAFFYNRIRQLHGKAVKLAPTERGVPDRLVLWPWGMMYLVELKTSTGKLDPAQVVWHDRVAEMGIQVVTLYGRADVIDWIRRVYREVDFAADPESSSDDLALLG